MSHLHVYYSFLFQPGNDIEKVAVERSFPEPRLAIFGSDEDGYTNMQGFIFTEGRVVFEVAEFSVPEALTALMGMHEQQVKKSARYSSFVDSVMIPDL